MRACKCLVGTHGYNDRVREWKLSCASLQDLNACGNEDDLKIELKRAADQALQLTTHRLEDDEQSRNADSRLKLQRRCAELEREVLVMQEMQKAAYSSKHNVVGHLHTVLCSTRGLAEF
jgi:hypothetical protein